MKSLNFSLGILACSFLSLLIFLFIFKSVFLNEYFYKINIKKYDVSSETSVNPSDLNNIIEKFVKYLNNENDTPNEYVETINSYFYNERALIMLSHLQTLMMVLKNALALLAILFLINFLSIVYFSCNWKTIFSRCLMCICAFNILSSSIVFIALKFSFLKIFLFLYNQFFTSSFWMLYFEGGNLIKILSIPIIQNASLMSVLLFILINCIIIATIKFCNKFLNIAN